jgi:hypothetical protein
MVSWPGNLIHHAGVVRAWARFTAPEVGSILGAVDALDSSPSSFESDDEEPIFVLSTGWRTGSTLLQRILVTDPRLLMWGEPWGRMALIPKLTESLCAVAEGWPPPEYLIDSDTPDFAVSWIANLFPPPSDLRAALRHLMNRWLGTPARTLGYGRWGFKEVRLSAADACLLRWLYPRGKFIILVRNPLDAYLSARLAQLWYRWPDLPIYGPVAFARHWNRLAVSWLDVPEDFRPIIIKYEDLVSTDFDFRSLERSLGLTLDAGRALSSRIGGSEKLERLTLRERQVVIRETRAGMSVYGYEA